jgi:Fe-S-cluster containining protein
VRPGSPDHQFAGSQDASAPVHCLAHHANFVCCHSGACCTSGWPIHVETDRLATLRNAVGAGSLTIPPDCAREGSPFLEPRSLPPGAGAVLRTTASGACVFYERADGLCAIQRTLGHGHLPSACQHFPRRSLVEPDRVAVSLSHYCPTVARLAFRTDVRPDIVPAPASLIGHIALEGLDAREALPPLLRPGMLTDLAGYQAWERVVIDILTMPHSPEAALAEISAFTERVRTWTPRDGDMRETVSRYRPVPRGRQEESVRMPNGPPDMAPLADAYEVVRASVPAGIATKPAPDRLDAIDARWVADPWPQFSQPLRSFLAAHAFGSWCAYHGMGLRTVVRSLSVALAVVRVEAAGLCASAERDLDEVTLTESMRAADLLLVHLADPKALATRLSTGERAQ